MSSDSNKASFTEQFQVASNEILSTIKKLISEGNVRRIIIRSSNGKQLFSLPLNAGAVVGGVVVLTAPMFAAIAAIAALAKNVTLEVERSDESESVVDVEIVDEQDASEALHAHASTGPDSPDATTPESAAGAEHNTTDYTI